MTQTDVHVWTIRLDVAPTVVRAHRDALDDDERARAERFARRRDADRFIVCRGAVRGVLASYLRAAPEDIEFIYSSYGKPGLCCGTLLQFNVSHSGDVAMCAVAEHRAVGVDVERVDRTLAFEPLAERFFSPRELASLREVAEQDRRLAFYRCWTRKEAYVKSTGRGLSHALDAFAVSLDDGRDAHLVWSSDPGESERWCLSGLDAPGGYVAAVAVERRAGRPMVRQMDWSHEHPLFTTGALCEPA